MCIYICTSIYEAFHEKYLKKTLILIKSHGEIFKAGVREMLTDINIITYII